MKQGPATGFGERLRAAAAARGYTNAQQLADALGGKKGASASQPLRWWKGEIRPDADNLERLVRLLDVDAHWLLLGEGEMQRRAPGEAERRLELVREALVRPLEDDDEELPPVLRTRSPEEREQGRSRPADGKGSA
jgi:transcriptional regulator with XRE-family HTH domain